MLSSLGMMWQVHRALEMPMYQSILEYIVNADMFYRLWMAADMQNPSTSPDNSAHPRSQWLPDLVDMFEDVRDVPALIRTVDSKHLLDNTFRFHTGNKYPTINAPSLELYWGVDEGSINPMRAVGPASIKFTGLQTWHHQNLLHRRRGDAIICKLATFEWNTRPGAGAFRANGPFQVIVKNFRAEYKKGVRVDATCDHVGVSWGTENGIRIGEERVQRVIKENDIQVNYLLSDSVFGDEGEEFIFWDEIGRQQEAA